MTLVRALCLAVQPERAASLPRVLACVALAGLAAAASLTEARACTCDAAASGRFLTASGLVPSDARGVVWTTADGLDPTPPDGPTFEVRFEASPGEWQPIPHDAQRIGEGLVLVTPRQRMRPLERYRVTAWDRDVRAIEVMVSPIAVAPYLGAATLEIGPVEVGELSIADGFSCSRNAEMVTRQVTLRLPPAIERFRHALLFETRVDARRWMPSRSLCDEVPPGRSWAALGDDLVATTCDQESPLQPGRDGADADRHDVELRVALPGTGVGTALFAALTLPCPPE